MNEKKIQFLDGLIDKSQSFALKRRGIEPRSISFFLLLSFNSLVFIVDFVYTWIYLFESGIRLLNKYIRRNVNNSLHAG